MVTTKYIGERVKIDTNTGCWLWQLALKSDGYGIATLNQKYIRAHRLSWQLFYGEIPKGKCILHRCDVRHCVNPDHLFIGTAQENSRDMIEKGRSARGESHSQAKLSTREVIDILESTDSHRVLAKRYNVSYGNIGNIKSGRTWGHIKAIVDSGVLSHGT